jgi:hypothetical protein
MQKYIGVKIVEAEAMTAGEFNKIKPDGNCKDRIVTDEGYMVKYPQGDGYVSWCPKDVFESSNRPANGLSFGMALDALKTGMSVRLPSWSEDVRVCAQFPDEKSKMTAPYLYVESRFGLVPWKETMIELFSDCWEIF